MLETRQVYQHRDIATENHSATTLTMTMTLNMYYKGINVCNLRRKKIKIKKDTSCKQAVKLVVDFD